MTNMRSRDVVAGAFVLVVPTVASVYAAWTQSWSAWARHLLFGAWLLAAGLIVVDQVRRNARSDEGLAALDSLTGERAVRLQHQANLARDAVFRSMLTDRAWFPARWDWTVYLYDTNAKTLRPVWPGASHARDALMNSFEPGQGATGQAWASEETILRFGQEVHDATHGLTDEQQLHFAKRNSVVATPIWADDAKIGVLAGLCHEEDRVFEAERDRSHIVQTATNLGTVLSSLTTGD